MGRDRQYQRRRRTPARLPPAQGRGRSARRERLREELSGKSARATARRAVSAKLVKVLGLLGSDHAGERDNAARQATRILNEARLTWYDVLDVEEPK